MAPWHPPNLEAMKNPYKEEISFAQLAKDDPDFAKVLKPNAHLDFSDPPSVLQLTKSLLKRDFNLTISLPPDRLCPPVPNRLNYLLWIDALLRSSQPLSLSPDDINPPPAASSHGASSHRKTTGLDIGTGASAIYPLLACASSPTYSFLATDIDPTSLSYASKNIALNNLSSRISLIPSTPSAPLISLRHSQTIDFTMCNPPFYASSDELETSAKQKARLPNTACTGSVNEMVTPGGEVAFISRMITESLVLREQVQWYTSMVGKLSSLAPLIERLREEGCVNWAVGELVQGTRTRRWVLGWSWGAWRPDLATARGVGRGALEKRLLSFPSEYTVAVAGKDAEATRKKIDGTMGASGLLWQWNGERGEGMGFAEGNVWGRNARRKKRGIDEPGTGESSRQKSSSDMAFGFRVAVKEAALNTEVLVRWIKGQDSVVFESFCGMIKRTVENEGIVKRKAEDGATSDATKKSRK